MLDSVKIARRQSEIRQALAGLVGKDTPSEDETRSMETLDSEYRTERNPLPRRAGRRGQRAARGQAPSWRPATDGQWADLVRRLRAAAGGAGRSTRAEPPTAGRPRWCRRCAATGGYRGVPGAVAGAGTALGRDHRLAACFDPMQMRPVIDRLFPDLRGRPHGRADDRHRHRPRRVPAHHVLRHGRLG